MIIKSNEIKGEFTHWVGIKHKESVLNGQFRLLPSSLPSKPTGLWLSWNGGWEYFCKYDYTDWMKGKTCLKAEIKPNLNIWLIDSFVDFIEVWNKFIYPEKINLNTDKFQYEICSFIKLYESKQKGKDFWEWLQTELKIDGVALTKIGQCETRMSTWLYGWDVASVVLFNPKNVVLKWKN